MGRGREEGGRGQRRVVEGEEKQNKVYAVSARSLVMASSPPKAALGRHGDEARLVK